MRCVPQEFLSLWGINHKLFLSLSAFIPPSNRFLFSFLSLLLVPSLFFYSAGVHKKEYYLTHPLFVISPDIICALQASTCQDYKSFKTDLRAEAAKSCCSLPEEVMDTNITSTREEILDCCSSHIEFKLPRSKQVQYCVYDLFMLPPCGQKEQI